MDLLRFRPQISRHGAGNSRFALFALQLTDAG
jgi:hypothetical protein